MYEKAEALMDQVRLAAARDTLEDDE